MKILANIFSILLLIIFAAGCGGSGRVVMPEGVSSDIAVLSLGGDTTGLSDDQVALLQRTIDWMDRDIVQSLTRKGFNAGLINSENDFTGTGNGHLLKISVTSHKLIPKGARFLGGMMAGADRLNTHYDLVDASGQTVLSWDDAQGSTKGGTYCAKTLNRNATEKVAAYLSAH